MKPFLFGLVLLLSTTAFAGNPIVDEKIEQQFLKTFPAAQKVKWYDYDSYYEVLFEHNNIPCRIKYDPEGKLLSVRRDYTEKDLSLFILGMIRQKFPTKKVFGVTEIASSEGLDYDIVLEDEKTWTIIKADSAGQIRVQKRLKKA